jgi:hypothetical protein
VRAASASLLFLLFLFSFIDLEGRSFNWANQVDLPQTQLETPLESTRG